MSKWSDDWVDDREDFRRGFFPASKPIAAKGGIKAGSQRGEFGKSWWAKRWIAVLESFDIGTRLGRGRSYARSGQVLTIGVEKGCVTATVQGSRPRPYAVTINVKNIPEAGWKKVAKELSSRAIYAAKLLGGEMPQDIESVFKAAGVPLFPEKLRDLDTDCSCPDDSNPCKHIAAVYYLLGEEFDRDPFLLFRLRGLDRKELFDLLGGSVKKRAVEVEAPVEAADPLPSDPKTFWSGRPVRDLAVEAAPGVSAALPKRLGNFPFWRGERPFLEEMEEVYRAASAKAESLLAREE